MTASAPRRSSSPCHSATGSAPMAATAARASRSSHDPGNVTTPTRTAGEPPCQSRPRASLSRPGQCVGPGRPGGHGPAVVLEIPVGDGGGGQVDLRVHPQEAAAGAEMPEGGGGAALAHPVRPLAVAQLEAEPPIAGIEAADPWDQPGEPGE